MIRSCTRVASPCLETSSLRCSSLQAVRLPVHVVLPQTSHHENQRLVLEERCFQRTGEKGVRDGRRVHGKALVGGSLYGEDTAGDTR
jgi:hypothetical protein